MTQPTFRSSRKFLGPPWLTSNGESELVGYTLDVIRDAFAERLRRGLLARFPQQDSTGQVITPDDALAAIGRDRQIIRGLFETTPAYAARLLTWLDTWVNAGSALSVLRQLKTFLGPLPSLRTVDAKGNWYSLAADGVTSSISLGRDNWDWDGDPNYFNRWSRFWVVVYPNGLWSGPGTWGDGGKWGDGRVWGTTAPYDAVQAMRGIVSQWKPAGTKCVNIILAGDPTSFNPATARDAAGLPDGTWGLPFRIVGGAYVPSNRLTTAAFLDGV